MLPVTRCSRFRRFHRVPGQGSDRLATVRDALPSPAAANPVVADRPMSLVGASMLWSRWSTELEMLRTPCLVIKAAAPSPAAVIAAASSRPLTQASAAKGPTEAHTRGVRSSFRVTGHGGTEDNVSGSQCQPREEGTRCE
jgi:hypothetical protein